MAFEFKVLEAWFTPGPPGPLGRLVARRDSGDKDSEFGSFVFRSFWAALAARGTWCEPGLLFIIIVNRWSTLKHS